jgi:hypothetical protein
MVSDGIMVSDSTGGDATASMRVERGMRNVKTKNVEVAR